MAGTANYNSVNLNERLIDWTKYYICLKVHKSQVVKMVMGTYKEVRRTEDITQGI